MKIFANKLFVIGLILSVASQLGGCGGSSVILGSSNTTSGTAPITVASSQNNVAVNGQVAFTASSYDKPAAGGDWAVMGGTGNGTIDSSGVFTAPSAVPTQPTVSLVTFFLIPNIVPASRSLRLL